MSKTKKILLLVEGAKTDVKIMENLLNIYGIDLDYKIVPYRTNIYTLYNEMFKDGAESAEDMDLIQVLKSREKDDKKKEIFDDRYTDVLLIFDLDPQDPSFNPNHIDEMQRYFSDSSDMGKLYINYPMVEAFYHMKSIPDLEYYNRKVSLTELKKKMYKSTVQKETRGNSYSKFASNKDEYDTIIIQNLSKAFHIINQSLCTVEEVLKLGSEINCTDILEKQLEYLEKNGYIYVLCTCVFFIIEYNSSLLDRKNINLELQ